MTLPVAVAPALKTEPAWKTVSVAFDATQFSILFSFEEALRALVGDTVHKLRPESTINAAIVMLSAQEGPAQRVMYAYRWYHMRSSAVAAGLEMRPALVFSAGDSPPEDLKTAIQKGLPFVFSQPITLAAAFLHHEIQRRHETSEMLAPIKVSSKSHGDRLSKYWEALDDDKKELRNGVYRIDNPGTRYKGLHRETFSESSTTGKTIATFVKPIVIRDELLGLFCVDIASNSSVKARSLVSGQTPRGKKKLESFTDGLASLGLGIGATLGACSKAYYTHLDRPAVPQTSEPIGEPPNLSAAFLETLVAELEIQDIHDLQQAVGGYFFFDNDDLKAINGLGNYECGTAVIRATGRWIKDGIRSWSKSRGEDPGKGRLADRLELSPQSWVIRWGGDEFIAIVIGGKCEKQDWIELLKCIESEIAGNKEALAQEVCALASLKGRTVDQRRRLSDAIEMMSISAGGVYVQRIKYTPTFLRGSRTLAEDRMKLIKSLSKMDHELLRQLLVEMPKDDRIKPGGDLRWWCDSGVED